MRKKVTSFLLIAAITVLMLGCGQKEKPVSDTLRYFNAAYAIITLRNGGDYNLVGGFSPEDRNNIRILKRGLESSWDVTDSQTARETMDWILSEGHNSGAVQIYEENEMDSFTRQELEEILSEPDYTPEERVMYLSVYDAVEKFGENAILAWDLSRAQQLLGWYYLTGLYTYEEAMDKSLEVARLLQESYGSWEEMMESYFLGYQYWAEESAEDSQSEVYKRVEMYQKLKEEENGPYTLDWNMELKKEW